MKAKPTKPYNGGKWSEARMRSFAMSALRRAQWPAKYASIDAAFVGDGINPDTGKKCKLHKCPECQRVLPKGSFHADHLEPVIPLGGFANGADGWLGYDWNQVMRRLWVEASGYRAICEACHVAKSTAENRERKESRERIQ
jgi:hypothetical protein